MKLTIKGIPVKYVLQGFKNYILDKISDIKYKDVFNARYEICKQCEKRDGAFCSVCGCLLKVKTKVEECKCPDDKWITISEMKKRKEI